VRAVVVEAFDRTPAVEEVPKPTPGPNEVLVRIEASGLCHTDIHAAHGDWPVQPSLPFTPGHEGVGIVEELGSDVDGPLESIGTAMDDVLAGRVPARIVFEFSHLG
jgi:alcohol dehydrogenase, propanol-preferring